VAVWQCGTTRQCGSLAYKAVWSCGIQGSVAVWHTRQCGSVAVWHTRQCGSLAVCHARQCGSLAVWHYKAVWQCVTVLRAMYLTIYLMTSLKTIPYLHRIYIRFWPTLDDKLCVRQAVHGSLAGPCLQSTVWCLGCGMLSWLWGRRISA